MRSYKRVVIGVAAALLAVGNLGCAARQPPGPDPWVTAGQQASTAASRAEATAARTETAAKRVEDATARAEASVTRSMRK